MPPHNDGSSDPDLQPIRSGLDFDDVAPLLADDAYTLAAYLMGDPADAEDAVVECYRVARRRFDSGAQAIRPWLLAILHSVCEARIARRSTRGWVAPGRRGRADSDADRRLIHGLPRLLREALVLRECCGLSYAEIAIVVGATQGAVLGRLQQARAILQVELARGAEVPPPSRHCRERAGARAVCRG